MAFHIQDQAGRLFRLPQLERLPVLWFGWAGVDLFFILSGFILMHVHGAEFRDRSAAPLLRFAKLRIARVYPLNLAVLLLIAALIAVDAPFAAWCEGRNAALFTTAGFLRTALLATRWFVPEAGDWNQPVWSLSAEVVGYAMFPFIAALLAGQRSFRRTLVMAFIPLVLLALFQIATRTAGTNDISVTGALTRMAGGFTAGACLYRAWMLAPGRLIRQSGGLAVLGCSAILVAAVFWSTATAAFFGFAVLVPALACGDHWAARLLSTRPILFLGRISFPLYLFHLTALNWVRYQFGPAIASPAGGIAAIAIYVAFCLGAATLLHRYVEVPSQRLGKVWAKGRLVPS